MPNKVPHDLATTYIPPLLGSFSHQSHVGLLRTCHLHVGLGTSIHARPIGLSLSSSLFVRFCIMLIKFLPVSVSVLKNFTWSVFFYPLNCYFLREAFWFLIGCLNSPQTRWAFVFVAHGIFKIIQLITCHFCLKYVLLIPCSRKAGTPAGEFTLCTEPLAQCRVCSNHSVSSHAFYRWTEAGRCFHVNHPGSSAAAEVLLSKLRAFSSITMLAEIFEYAIDKLH